MFYFTHPKKGDSPQPTVRRPPIDNLGTKTTFLFPGKAKRWLAGTKSAILFPGKAKRQLGGTKREFLFPMGVDNELAGTKEEAFVPEEGG